MTFLSGLTSAHQTMLHLWLITWFLGRKETLIVFSFRREWKWIGVNQIQQLWRGMNHSEGSNFCEATQQEVPFTQCLRQPRLLIHYFFWRAYPRLLIKLVISEIYVTGLLPAVQIWAKEFVCDRELVTQPGPSFFQAERPYLKSCYRKHCPDIYEIRGWQTGSCLSVRHPTSFRPKSTWKQLIGNGVGWLGLFSSF